MKLVCEARSRTDNRSLVEVDFQTEKLEGSGEIIAVNGSGASRVKELLQQPQMYTIDIGIMVCDHRPDLFRYVVAAVHRFAQEVDCECVATSGDIRIF